MNLIAAKKRNDHLREMRARLVQNSGKILIIGIVAAAAALAGGGWWFRYSATHRAAEFWGPRAVRLIRDAPRVTFVDLDADEPAHRRDVSSARGLTHLRNALLEDRSFDWPASTGPLVTKPSKMLEFGLDSDVAGSALRLYFSPDLHWVMDASPDGTTHSAISSRPIAKGLAEMFGEFAEAPPAR
jgi:hypothetical protein